MGKIVKTFTKPQKLAGIGYTNFIFLDFGSIGEMLKYIKISEYNPVSTNPNSSHKGSKYFTGTSTYTEAMQLLENGWNEGAAKIDKGLKEVLKNNTSVTQRQRSVYDVVGGNASVPRYLQGVPTSMIRQVKTPVKQPITDVYIDYCFSSTTSQYTIINRCIEVLQKVVSLENAGTRVNLYAYKTAVFGDYAELSRVCLKRSTERLNVLKLAFPAAHPSMLRRIAFAVDEHTIELPEYWFPGYGCPKKGDAAREEFLKIIKE